MRCGGHGRAVLAFGGGEDLTPFVACKSHRHKEGGGVSLVVQRVCGTPAERTLIVGIRRRNTRLKRVEEVMREKGISESTQRDLHERQE